ncbi:MAG: DNA polymerase III subunit alpha [Rickettsiales bacterium]|nr:DNA polymerase III subunit alpha [Rickettsiales bacterium]
MNKPFIHLRTLSSYSLSESALKIKNIVNLAKKNNMPAIALTDNNNMFGALEFSLECSSNGIQPIIGASINILDVNYKDKVSQITFLVKNEKGYKNLLYLTSLCHVSENYPIGIYLNDIQKYSEGLFCFLGGEFNPLLILHNNRKVNLIEPFLKSLLNIFDTNLLFELQRIEESEINSFENYFIELSNRFNVPLIGTNNIKFENEEDYSAHDALLCIAQKTTINSSKRKSSNPNLYFKNNHEMLKLFNDVPEVIENNFNVAINCNYFPVEINPRLPKFHHDNELTEKDLLISNSKEGLKKKFDNHNLHNIEEYKKRLDYELNIIIKMGYEGYFLIVSDFVNWAKNNNIPVGPGRGSGAGSLVAWSLGITDLNPLDYGLLFERFLNPERVSMPDFDIDFCQNRRDEVIEYVNNKYGKECVAHIITFGTLASRAAVRDIGRVLEVPYGEVDQFAKLIPYNPANPLSLKESIENEKNLKEAISNDERLSNVVDISLKLEGLHRHASTHAAGIVIGDTKISNLVPLYKDPNTNVNATQFSMKYVEKAGLIKFDFLGLTTLSIIKDCVKLIQIENPNFDLKKIPLDDSKTFSQLSKGETVGIFQLESAGMGSVLRQLQPNKFEEIIAVVALFRPGPMDNIPSYCNRKHSREKIEYLHPLLEQVLKETYGIIVYQEQVMEIAQVLSKYSLGEADLLRRAMGKKIQKEMDLQKNRFIEGALKNNITEIESSKIFDLVNKFAGYGFNKSHAAGYAMIAYQTAFLKSNFPHEFITTTLNYSIDRTDRIILLKKELERLNIKFLKPDINKSQEYFSIEKDNKKEKCIRFGLGAIKGVGIKSMKSLILEREENGSYKDIISFMQRLKTEVINKRQLEKLIQSGSFDCIELNRAKLFQNVVRFVELFSNGKNEINQTLLFADEKIEFNDKNLFFQNINDWKVGNLLKNELEVIGFYFSSHPLSLYPSLFFKTQEITDIQTIESEKNKINFKVAGSILDIKERSNKDGKKYAFITVSTIAEQFELTIFSENLYKFRSLIKEGNVCLFDIEAIRNNQDTRYIIKKIIDFESYFNQFNKKINIYTSLEILNETKNELLNLNNESKENIYIYTNIDNKLITLNLNQKYSLKSYTKLDSLKNSKKLDYSIDLT